MVGLLFAHLFHGRAGYPVGTASPGVLVAPEAPGDCFPHVIVAPLSLLFHSRHSKRLVSAPSVGKFPQVTDTLPAASARGVRGGSAE